LSTERFLTAFSEAGRVAGFIIPTVQARLEAYDASADLDAELIFRNESQRRLNSRQFDRKWTET